MAMKDFKDLAKERFNDQITDYISEWIDSQYADEFIEDVFNEIEIEDPTDAQYVSAKKYVHELLQTFEAKIGE